MANEIKTNLKGSEELQAALTQAFGDRYQLVARLGAGAYGVVFRAVDTMLDRDVAIKQVRVDHIQDSDQVEEMKRRSQREAKMAAKLHHPNIVAVHDVVHTDRGTLLIMEFVDGETLESRLRGPRGIGFAQTLDLVEQTAGALDHAHEHGVVHRDIKPANLMIDRRGRVKITDFGIAKAQAGSPMTSDLTATGNVLGTPCYMSPEQARGESELDGRSDLFSLGCVTYECLAGHKAFRGKSVVEVLLQVVNGRPEELDYEALNINAEVELVLERALAKEPPKRYQTATGFVEALRAVPPYGPDDDASRSSSVVTSREPGASTSFDIDLQGSLAERTLAEILHDIRVSGKTGILHVQREDISKRLYFLDGSIAFANSDVEQDRLGQLLLQGGVVDEISYERALKAVKKTRRRFGKSLISQGLLDEASLDAHIDDQIRHIIRSVFSWASGHYGFENIANPVEEDIAREFSTDEIILDGVRLASDTSIRKAIGTLDRIPKHAESPSMDSAKMTLTASEGFVLSRVDGSTSAADIAAISPLGENETLRCIYGLVSAGILTLHDPKGKSTPRARKAAEAPPPAPKPQEAASEPENDGALEAIAAKHAALERANLYELLEVSRGATPGAIKKCYYTLAKRFHPDRHQDTGDEVQAKLSDILVRLSRAYEVLSSPPKRLRYDNQLPPEPEPKTEPEPEPEPVRKAGGEENKEPAVQTVRTSPEVVAEAKYRAGQGYFQDRDYHEAVEHLREAVRLAPEKPAYHKLLAKALMKNPKWRKQAESHVNIALAAEPFDTECYLDLALIYEEGRLPTRARKMYEQVLLLDPDHEIALAKLNDETKSGKTAILRKLLSSRKSGSR